MQSSHPRTKLHGSKNGAFQTDPNTIERQYGFSYHIITSSAAALNATATVQASNDGTNWADTSITAAITADGSKIINVDAVHYMFTRLSFTFAAGAGTFKTIFCSKGA